MKIRTGFVSNSSSSSFCLYGIAITNIQALFNKLITPETTKIEGCIHDFDREKCKFCPECGKSAWFIEEYEGDIFEDLSDYFEKNYNLDCENGNQYYFEDQIFIGKNVDTSIKPTLEQLIKVREKLKKLYPDYISQFYFGFVEN
jgi:hypothetical protein